MRKTEAARPADLYVPKGVSELIGGLSRKRREVIRPVLEHPRDYVLLSVRGLAAALGTDPATTLRIVQGMRFRTYRDFQRYLHELSVIQATSLDLMRAAWKKDSGVPAHVRESLDRDLKNIQALRHSIDFRQVVGLAEKLYAARRILILGGDLATTLASYLDYNLMILGLPVCSAFSVGQMVHASRAIGKNDLCIAISFRRGLRQTVEGVQQARANGAHCVGITDTYISPIARFSHECFIASIDGPSLGGSYVAPMALVNVLIIACANYRRARTLALLRAAEKEQRAGFRWYNTN